MSSKHTPGMLYAVATLRTQDGTYRSAVNIDGVTVAVAVGSNFNEAAANAARIVNSWNCHDELLEALEFLLRVGPSGIIGQQVAREKAVAVIARAGGAK